MTLEEIQAAVTALQAQQAQPATPAQAAAPTQAQPAHAAFDYAAMAKANAEAFAAVQAAAQPKPAEPVQRPPVAAAPSAPSGANLPTADGIVNLWAVEPSRLAALGPQFVRAELEKAWGLADDLSGRPRKPALPGQKKGNR